MLVLDTASTARSGPVQSFQATGPGTGAASGGGTGRCCPNHGSWFVQGSKTAVCSPVRASDSSCIMNVSAVSPRRPLRGLAGSAVVNPVNPAPELELAPPPWPCGHFARK